KKQVEELHKAIQDLREKGEGKDQKIAELTQSVEKGRQEKKLIQMRIENRDQVIRDLRKELIHLQKDLSKAKAQNQERDSIIQDLKRQLRSAKKPGISPPSEEKLK
ncbi:MAG: hypothetical protein ACE5I8_12045, partial [Thermodesulfobacteriota bacterium]